MLDLLGVEYVIDHVISEHNKRLEEFAYRNYTSDLLKVIAENMGVEVNSRFADFIQIGEKDERSADDIVLDIMKKAGLKGKQDGCS